MKEKKGNIFNMFVRAQWYTQCVLVRDITFVESTFNGQYEQEK